MRADIRIDAGQAAAGLLGARRLAAQHIHVGRRAAKIGDNAGKAGNRVANRFDFIDDRIFGTALNDAPSCSVIEQKEQPPKQPRIMLIEKRIISYAGMRASPYEGCGTRLYGSANTLSISSVESGIAGGLTQI
jgi:hypothetical protein